MDDYPLLQSLIDNSKSNKQLQDFFKTDLQLTSVFDVSRLTEADFKERFKQHAKEKFKDIDLSKLYDDAKCFAAQISHLYREKQLSSEKAQHHWHPPGIRGVEKQGPTYTNLFQENWNDACKIDSIAAIDSPVAYLRALYLFAKQLETSTSAEKEKAKRILLQQRRPDLAKLSIDQQSTFTAQPMLDIVNQTLDNNIQEALKATDFNGQSTYEVLAKTQYPFALPYEFFHHQCLLGLGARKLSLGELNYLISTRLPLTQAINNQYGKVLSSSSADAQKLMSGLGPQQQAALTEALLNEKLLSETANSARLRPVEVEAKALYWKKIYGLDNPSSLKNLNTFLERTELNAEQMEVLLAQGKHAPRRSTNDLAATPPALPHGARYINGPHSAGRNTVATMKLVKTEGGIKTIDQLTDRRLERLHRMIRLHRWLDIPFADLDSLIVSAFESQVPRNASMQLDAHTVSTLGIYRHFNRRYSIDAEEFGALLHQVTPYSNSDAPSLFDRVFNRARLFDKPLVLDGHAFTADNSDPASHTILQHLSASLGLALTEDSLLMIVKNTEKYLGSLKCDLPTLSSIYRQARIARLFGISIADSAAVAKWLGGESISRCLANGNSSIHTLRITAIRDRERIEVVARYQLPAPADSTMPSLLLPGSTLKTNTSWFAGPENVNELFIQFVSDSRVLPSITISQISTAAANTEISLENVPIVLTNGALEAIADGKSAMTTALRYSRDNKQMASPIYINTTVASDTKADISILDVLMQMDWLTNWLHESVFSISKLRRLLEPRNSDDHGFLDLQQHLSKLNRDANAAAVTPEEIAKLSLPNDVEWRKELANTLLDDKGLLINFAPGIEDDVPQQLETALDLLISKLKPVEGDAPRIKPETKKNLYDMLLLAHDRQLHTVEKFLQEICQLPMNCARGVVSWAGTSVYQILTAALHEHPPLEELHPVLRHAEAAVQLNLSNRALRLFLKYPGWLGISGAQLELTLHSMYLLDRFNHCMITHQHPEESLLSYLVLVHSDASTTAINNSLATLLNGTVAEVTVLTARLNNQKARSMKDLDWLMRCQETCRATGLSAASLLDATALNNQSLPDAWKKVGEAVIAASH